jgi:hypothetical protein
LVAALFGSALSADLAPFSDERRSLNFAGLQAEGKTMMRQAFGGRYALEAEI